MQETNDEKMPHELMHHELMNQSYNYGFATIHKKKLTVRGPD